MAKVNGFFMDSYPEKHIKTFKYAMKFLLIFPISGPMKTLEVN